MTNAGDFSKKKLVYIVKNVLETASVLFQHEV